MDATQLLELVRRGFAVATPRQVALVRSCLDVEVVGEEWVPRWALEAEAALEEAGYGAERIENVFAHGRGSVLAELEALVRSGQRARVLEPRQPFAPAPFDARTYAALAVAVQRHDAVCARCSAGARCEEGQELADELALLFPRDRRAQPRS